MSDANIQQSITGSAQVLGSTLVNTKQWTHPAALSTKFAAERTMMAAVRTSLSLIGFGFTIYKFFESIVHTLGTNRLVHMEAPRRVGTTLITLGVFVLIGSAFQHWRFLNDLKRDTGEQFTWSVPMITAIALTAMGLIMLVTIVVRL